MTHKLRRPEALATALDALLEAIDSPESEDSDVVRCAMIVLRESGRVPAVWSGSGEDA